MEIALCHKARGEVIGVLFAKGNENISVINASGLKDGVVPWVADGDGDVFSFHEGLGHRFAAIDDGKAVFLGIEHVDDVGGI